MKNVLLSLLLLLLCTANLWSQNEADKTTIQQVIANETDRWAAKDYAGWAKNWLQTPEIVSSFNNQDGSYGYILGWDALSEGMKQSFQQDPQPTYLKVIRENYTFRFYSNGAFVTFDQYFGKKGEVKPSKEFRVMEKTEDGWKLVSAISLWDYSN